MYYGKDDPDLWQEIGMGDGGFMELEFKSGEWSQEKREKVYGCGLKK